MADMDITTNTMAIHPNKIKYAVLTAVLCLMMSLAAGCGKAPAAGTERTEALAPTETNKPLKSGQVAYNGNVYTYNDHLSNFLFLGVDKRELAETTMGATDAGQTDALFLLSWDRVTGDVTLITIPRDTMTMINSYGRDGTDLGPVKQHISMAYGFGDGKHESCKLSEEAVSRLFYRIPIQGYCATTMDALTEIGKVTGPVTVTVPNDSLAEKDPAMTKGAEAVIDESNIELFVRYRDTNIDHSALTRTERQNVFLKASFDVIQKEFKSRPSIVSNLYEQLTPYMVTNMGNDQFFKIMESISKGGTITQWTVPGEGVTTDLYDEYHVDEDALYEMILESFFEEEE